ncbi:probable disease resistance protein RF9 isoform X2 [Mangifera indica]|uniref:probable disease resistance protein RF9 isoform X2 n=1 Tax=Mangifera indica TaxID=29780 RepID=UPI001CFC4570|nr:probable disease resistance protein RF9 isoform X2 [Mangifera indica]
MADAAGNAVIEVGKCLSAPIGRQFKYLYNYKTNFHNLKKEAGKLEDAREEVKAKVVAAKKNVEKIKQTVEDWQGDVDSTIEETRKLIQEKSNSSCFNLITYHKNGRKAWKKLNAITELLQEKEKFAGVSHPTTREHNRLTNIDYEEFESRRSVFNDVLKALDDPAVGIIGVYGMGGIGKTTLVKEVGQQAKNNPKLNEVVFVEVSDKPDTKKIQDELARQLGVKFEEEAERASKLCARLKNDTNVLVILDNIWEQLDLQALGIPCGKDRGGCKLLLTARDLTVLRSMDSKNNFLMGVLREEEAWSLFKKMAGDIVDQTNKLGSLPNEVCNECQGLPIVITTIARALRNKQSCSEWRAARRKLRQPSPTEFAGVLGNGYSKIELSYNYLKSHELKKTLLICSLMKNNTTISYLFKLIMGLDILNGANLSIEQARDEVASLVGELKYSCLLLDGSTSERFSMHDVVRSVAIIIAYKDHVFTERNDFRREWSNEKQLKKCTMISLADCHMISGILPLNCPKLKFFSSRMDNPFEIPENFFEKITNLKVLSFFYLKVSSLPKSLGFLINVQTLYLDFGKFSDVSIIGKLKKLNILSLRCCRIIQLPGEIGNLTQLQFLDLSYCVQLKVIVPNVMSSLLQLEELYVRGCSILWKADVLEELKGLSKLTTLEIEISDDQILQEDFFSKKFERYNISIGNGATEFGESLITGDWKLMAVESYWLIERADLRMLKLNLNSFICHEELQLLSNVEFLCVDKLQGIKNDLSELDKKGFSELKYLYVHNNPNIVCIVDSTKCISHKVFPLLESLIVFNLINLEKICYGPPSTEFFYHLKFIEVKGCDKLENILSFSNASKSLSQLQLIKVEDCKNLAEIFAVESKNRASKNEVIDKIEFCQLRFLKLCELPRIASFYSNINSEDVEIDTVIPFFDEKVVFRSLEALELKAINFEKIWDDKLPTTSCCYQNLERLIVDGCQKLKFVFPSSIIENFKQLQHLEINCCEELKEIVAKEETEGTTTFIFPRVVFLKLRELPELTTFYHDKHNSNWPMLKELEVHNCGKLDIFTSEYKVVVPNLKFLKLQSVNCEILWDSQLVATSSCYQNLTNLILNGCGKLQYVFLSSMVKSFEQLRYIEICNCNVLKEIISKGVEANKTFVFSRVTFLKLENLPELTTFYPGVHTSEWPVLKMLEVYNCGKIKTFTSEYMSFFLAEKINPNLEKLTLSRADDMIKFLHQFPEKFCRCTIDIKQDKSANISVGILQRSVKLEKLILFDCSYEEIFTCGEDEKHTNILIQIKSLELRHLSDAKYLWGKGSKLDSLLQNLEVLEVDGCDRMINVLPSSASFENLTVLNVYSCDGLMNLLTPAIAKNLVQLREMQIKSCRMMTEIVSNKTEDVAAEDEIVFGKLKLLSLEYLQNLTCFYSGNYALKFPSLEELTVDGCPMMKTFSVGNLNTPSLQKVQQDRWDKRKWSWNGHLNTTIQQLYEKEVNSESEELTLSGKDVTLIWQDQLPEHQFSKVKILKITKDESSNIPIGSLQRFNNLKKLVLRSSSYEEIFLCEKDEKHVSMLTQIKELELWGLFNLEYIWKEKSHLGSILQNLEMLNVNFCHNLISLVSSSATFENLITLEVWYCDGLINLVSSSTAKSLVRLEKLRLSECKMMAEVVSSEGSTKAEEIVFEKLKLLSLRNLKNLTSFCSGNYVFKFPALEELIVHECHNMKTFFEGVLSVPSLREVKKLDGELGCWEGDLNTTIQFLHRKK